MGVHPYGHICLDEITAKKPPKENGPKPKDGCEDVNEGDNSIQ